MDWRCTNCGTTHPRNNPPCHECGGMEYDQMVVRLEWECDSCGEPTDSPHEPCPNCGGEEFSCISDTNSGPAPLDDEVRVKPDAASEQDQQLHDNIVWECTDCGKQHMRNSPPCNRCGGTQLEKIPFEETITDPPRKQNPLTAFFDRTSSALSLTGLALAVLGGVVIMYGGSLGATTYRTTGQMPPDAWQTIVIGAIVVALGTGFVLFDTRLSDTPY